MKALFLIIISFTVFAFQCNKNPTSSGTGGEITNGVCYDEDKPEENVFVTPYEIDSNAGFNTSENGTIVTDTSGSFVIDLKEGKAYNLFFWDTASKKGAFIGPLTKDTSLGRIDLKTPGRLKGKILIDSSDVYLFAIFIPGSPFYTEASGTGEFTLEKLPPSTYDVTIRRMRRRKSAHEERTRDTTIAVDIFENVTTDCGTLVLWSPAASNDNHILFLKARNKPKRIAK